VAGAIKPGAISTGGSGGRSVRSGVSQIPVIGLVGGIGSGKSEVARLLAAAGCLVCDSDALAREALRDPAIRTRLLDRWGSRGGEGVIGADGAIDRRAVAGIVFDDPAERAFLESLTHPWIEAKRRTIFASAVPSTVACVIDAPLLLEAGLGAQCNAVFFVDAPRSTRLERVMRSRGWPEAELARREAAQLPIEEKRRRATVVLDNDGDRDALRSQVEEALEDLVARFRGHPGAAR